MSVCSRCGLELPPGAQFCSGCGSPVAAPAVSWLASMGASRPGISEWMRLGWESLRHRPAVLMLVAFGYMVVSWAPGLLFRAAGGSELSPAQILVFDLISFGVHLALVPLGVGMTLYCLLLQRGESPPSEAVFYGYARPWQVCAAYFMGAVLTAVGLLLLIVPGLIVAMGLLFAPLLVLDRGLGPVEALRASWDLTRGYRLRLLGLNVVLFLLVIPAALLTCGLAVLPFLGILAGAQAAAYRDLLARRGPEGPPGGVTTEAPPSSSASP